jgi:hypothetical protein
MDLVITGREGGGSWSSDLKTVYRAPDDLALATPIHGLACEPVDLRGAHITASERPEAAASLASGTGPWATAGPIRGGEWLEVRLPEARPIGRVEVFLGNEPWKRPPAFEIATGQAPKVEGVPVVADTPGLRELLGLGRPESEGLVLAPRPVRVVRVTQTAAGDLPWVVSGILLEACEER